MRRLARKLAWAVCASAGWIAGAAADNFEHKWFKITGYWNGRELRADRLQLRDPYRRPNRGQVSGRVDRVDRDGRWFRIGPYRIVWTDETEFKDIAPHRLRVGVTLKVSLSVEAETQARARAIALESTSYAPGSLQIVGLSGLSEELPDYTHHFHVLGIPVYTTENGYNVFKSLTRRQDVRRPDDQYKVDVFDKPLTIGGEYNLNPGFRNDFDLDPQDDDRSVRMDQELKLEFFYPFDPFSALFVSFKGITESRFDLGRQGTGQTLLELARDETWLYFDRIGGTGFGLQVGNQNISETREWWWDKDMDALRLYYNYGPLHFELAAGRQLGGESTQQGIDPADQGVYRLLGLGSWMWTRKQRLEFFFLRQWDRSSRESVGALVDQDLRDASDGDLTWFGVRGIGEQDLGDGGKLMYWADLAGVHGRETVYDFRRFNGRLRQVRSASTRDVGGWAFDIGASWTLPFHFEPTFTLGYARASGDDDPDDGVDGAFRQTGIQRNKWRFNGVNRFRIYGELLRPELSNIRILTSAFGIRLLRNSSIELIYHRYDQVVAADSQREIGLNADPGGLDRELGQEWNAVANFREWKHWELSLTGAAFVAGDAFAAERGDLAYSVFFEVNYNF